MTATWTDLAPTLLPLAAAVVLVTWATMRRTR